MIFLLQIHGVMSHFSHGHVCSRIAYYKVESHITVTAKTGTF